MTTVDQNNKIIILLEDLDQYNAFIKAQDEYKTYAKIFYALTPEAIHLCERENLPHILPEDCFSEIDYYNNKKISEENIKDLISILNQYCSEISLKKIGFGLEVGNYFYFLLYHALGVLHYRSFLITTLIKKENPELLISFRLKHALPWDMGFYLSDHNNSYSNLLLNSEYKNKCRNIEYDCEDKSKKGKKYLFEGLKRSIKSYLRSFPALYSFYILWGNNIKQNPVDKIICSYKKRILLIGAPYNWRFVLKHPKAKSDFWISWIDDSSILTKSKVINADCFKEWFGWENRFLGFSLAGLMYEPMSIVAATFQQMMDNHHRCLKKINKYDVILASVVPFPDGNYILNIAKHLKKPIILYQHGETSLNDPSLIPESCELLYPDYYFSYGEAVSEKYFEYVGKISNFKGPISIGSASLDNLLSLKNRQGKYILYATGKYLTYSIPFNATIGPDYRLYNSQIKMNAFLEKLASNNDRSLPVVWKLNNTPDSCSNVPFRISDKITSVHFEKTFTELIADAKLVILDAPATTCLEVCATDKPLFVLLNRIKWFPKAEELLRKRAIVAHTPDDLVKKIDDYLNTGHYEADINNREFIRAYGTHLDDGKSAERAIDFLLKL